MRLTLKQLHNLPVETVSGHQLGRVTDVEIDVDHQEILRYHVRSRVFIPGLFERQLFIDRRQVVSLTTEKMVVEDAIRGLAERGFRSAPEPDAPLST